MLKNYTFNRPISPHLSIYLPQVSSLFSIWHRISGLVLITFLFSSIISLEILLNFNFVFINFIYFSYWIKEFVYLTFIMFFSYHSLNGFRHIFWDLILFFKVKSLWLSSILLLLLVLFILLKTSTLF